MTFNMLQMVLLLLSKAGRMAAAAAAGIRALPATSDHRCSTVALAGHLYRTYPPAIHHAAATR